MFEVGGVLVIVGVIVGVGACLRGRRMRRTIVETSASTSAKSGMLILRIVAILSADPCQSSIVAVRLPIRSSPASVRARLTETSVAASRIAKSGARQSQARTG